MSAVSAIRTKRSQTFSGRRGNDSLLALRLPPSEINILRWVFSDLEGYVGLGSNFGRMCDNMRSGQLVKDLRESGWAVGDGPSDGDDFCKPAGAKTVGMDAIYMHVGTAHRTRLKDSPSDGFVCWSNHGYDGSGKPRLGTAIGLAREALSMLDVKHVVVLAKMYSAEPEGKADPMFSAVELGTDGKPKPPEPPPWRWTSDYKMLGDVVVLGTMTETVTAHAEKLTREMREDFHTKCFERGLLLPASDTSRRKTADDVERHARESRLIVTELEAMADLLIHRSGESREKKRQRDELALQVKREANNLLVVASSAYRMARTRIDGERVVGHWAGVRKIRPRGVDSEQNCGGCGRQVRFSEGSVYCGCDG